jgi:restriction system protein
MQAPLNLDLLAVAAVKYVHEISGADIPSLFGVTDGKAVGTFVESGFNEFIMRSYRHTAGNAARGIDFPELNVDLKVTSIRQPQSSSPFRDATQKVYGLGYHLLVMVYDKLDDPEARVARLEIKHILWIEDNLTGDFQITSAINRILDNGGNADDIDALLEEKNLPLDPDARRVLADRIVEEPPLIGGLTISNALQWRLQYTRAIHAAELHETEGILDLLA